MQCSPALHVSKRKSESHEMWTVRKLWICKVCVCISLLFIISCIHWAPIVRFMCILRYWNVSKLFIAFYLFHVIVFSCSKWKWGSRIKVKIIELNWTERRGHFNIKVCLQMKIIQKIKKDFKINQCLDWTSSCPGKTLKPFKFFSLFRYYFLLRFKVKQ